MKPESRLRARCRMFLDTHLVSPCWFTALEHGRKHSGTAEQRAREWQHMKAQGVKQGIGDMLILAPGYCLFVEFKAGANKQSDAQHAFQAVMAVLGHGYAVVRSVEQLGEALQDNGIPIAPGWRIKAQLHDLALDGERLAKKRTPSRPRAPALNRTQAKALARLAKAGVFTR